MTRLSQRGWIGYGLATLVGLGVVFDLLPLAVIAGGGGVWQMPSVDLAQNLIGHLAFQRGGWTFPPLLAPDLFWPHGVAIVLTDSNPLVSLLAKLLATLRGSPPINLLGFWFATCWLLQPVAAVYALRGFGCRNWEAALAAAILAAWFPALLFRVGHINLCGHFVMLLALGLSARMLDRDGCDRARDWIAPFILLTAAVLIHPTLFILSAGLLAAPPLRAVLDRGWRGWRPVTGYLASGVLSVGLFSVLSGMIGAGGRGFGFYSMNLLSPVWPQRSGLFGPDLPVLDDTGGQYEGFNYLGGGVLLLIAAAAVTLAVQAIRRRGTGHSGYDWQTWRALAIVLGAMTLVAASSEIHAGHYLLVSLGTRSWDIVFGAVQSSGRLFWPVGYTLMLGSIAVMTGRLPRGLAAVLLAGAVWLQWVDVAPLRQAARHYFADVPADIAPFVIPDGTKLLTTTPACVSMPRSEKVAAQLQAQAMRLGARLSNVKVSRLPAWFNCESELTDAVEMPLRAGEIRVFLEPIAIDRFHQTALGEGAECRRYPEALACARDVPLTGGEVAPPGPALPVVTLLTGGPTEALDPILSFGWKRDARGAAWSEGPRATLQARIAGLAPGAKVVLRLKLAGIARDPSGDRPVTVRIGQGTPTLLHLADGRETEVALPAVVLADNLLRVSFDILRPIDPAKRPGLTAPVTRAGLRLESVTISTD